MPPAPVLDAEREAAVGEAVLFDASDTTDPDHESLTFLWNFGDGEKAGSSTMNYAFAKAGAHRVTLAVVDGAGNRAERQTRITVKAREAFVGGIDIIESEGMEALKTIFIFPKFFPIRRKAIHRNLLNFSIQVKRPLICRDLFWMTKTVGRGRM